MLPALEVAPPSVFWAKEEIAIDAFHHAVYALATGLAYEALSNNRQVRLAERTPEQDSAGCGALVDPPPRRGAAPSGSRSREWITLRATWPRCGRYPPKARGRPCGNEAAHPGSTP